MIVHIQYGENENKPWILDEYLTNMKNKMGLSVIGYAIYCQSDNILRVIANKMKRKIDFSQFSLIEYEWKRNNIQNIINKQSENPLGSKEKIFKHLIRKMIMKTSVITDPEIDAQVYQQYENLIKPKQRGNVAFRKSAVSAPHVPFNKDKSNDQEEEEEKLRRIRRISMKRNSTIAVIKINNDSNMNKNNKTEIMNSFIDFHVKSKQKQWQETNKKDENKMLLDLTQIQHMKHIDD